MQNVFVFIENYICPHCKMYLSILKIIFVLIAKCIWLVVACCYIWQPQINVTIGQSYSRLSL